MCILSDADYNGILETESAGYSAESRRKGADQMLTRFAQPATVIEDARRFFIHSPTMMIESYMQFGLPLDDPLWQNMIERLSRENERVYDNEAVVVYAGIPKYRPLEDR